MSKALPYTEDGTAFTDAETVLGGIGTGNLTIKNRSEILTTVAAEADWGAMTPKEECAAVQVELWCNGAKMVGDQYTQKLSEDNGWTYVWKDLPLFVDGAVARYTLREVMVGSTAYDSSEDNDGYRDYAVTYDVAKYREGDTGPYMNEATWVDGNNIRHYSPHTLLRVHNRNDNGQVTVFVTSQWDDQNNQDGLRPDSVTVKLFRDGIETGLTLTLSESNNWSGDFGDLKKYENGVVHQYTIKADAVDEYDSTIMGDMTSGFLVLNRHTQKTVTVAGSKFWENDAGKENLRPRIYRD